MRLELDQTGERLDAAIARLVPELSRSQAQRLLEEGLVTFAGKPLKKNEKSRAGMILEYRCVQRGFYCKRPDQYSFIIVSC